MLVKKRVEFRLHLAQALRNQAEGIRLTARTRRARERAIATVRRAVSEIAMVPTPHSDAVVQMAAYCSTSLSLCLADAGRLAEAIAAEAASLEKRRLLCSKSPQVYRRDWAFSLYTLAGYEMRRGCLQQALPLATEAVRHYGLLAKNSQEQIGMFWAEALRVKARILAKSNREKRALQCFAKAIGVLHHGYAQCPEAFRNALFSAIQEYAELAVKLDVPIARSVEDIVACEKQRAADTN